MIFIRSIVFICFWLFVQAIFAQEITVSKITILGLERTKELVVKKILPFQSGSKIDTSKVEKLQEETEELLKNSLLFNSVQVSFHKVNNQFVEVLVVLAERWYIWPFPVLEYADPNFNTWVRNGDLSRTNFGLDITDLNFRGMKDELAFKFKLGYSKEFSLRYDSPYFFKTKNWGLGGEVSYSQQNEINISTINDKRSFYIGKNGKSRELVHGNMYFEYNNKQRQIHQFSASFNGINIEDSLVILAPNYLGNTRGELQYISLSYYLKLDYRDSKVYPLKGWFLDVNLQKNGLGLSHNNSLDFAQVRTTLKFFTPIFDRTYFATSVTGKMYSETNIPYCTQQALGYYYNLRGYEFYVVDGQQFMLFKSNLKYAIVKPKKKDLFKSQSNKFSKFHYAFYVNLFFDAGYVKDDVYLSQNSLSNEFLLSGGIGIDFVTFYDRVMRIEYAVNGLNQTGFYLHFVQPI